MIAERWSGPPRGHQRTAESHVRTFLIYYYYYCCCCCCCWCCCFVRVRENLRAQKMAHAKSCTRTFGLLEKCCRCNGCKRNRCRGGRLPSGGGELATTFFLLDCETKRFLWSIRYSLFLCHLTNAACRPEWARCPWGPDAIQTWRFMIGLL